MTIFDQLWKKLQEKGPFVFFKKVANLWKYISNERKMVWFFLRELENRIILPAEQWAYALIDEAFDQNSKYALTFKQQNEYNFR